MDSQNLSVKDLQKKARLEKDLDVKIFNPDADDFTVKYHGKPYTIPFRRIATFKKPVAEHIKLHLAKHIYDKKGHGRHISEIDNIIKRIEDVTLHVKS